MFDVPALCGWIALQRRYTFMYIITPTFKVHVTHPRQFLLKLELQGIACVPLFKNGPTLSFQMMNEIFDSGYWHERDILLIDKYSAPEVQIPYSENCRSDKIAIIS